MNKKLSIIALVAPLAFAALSAQAAGPETASATVNASVKIIQPISVTKNTDIAFGTFVKPATGSATVGVDNAGAKIVGTGAAAPASSVTSNAQFTVSGEGAQSIAVTVPATFSLTNGANSLTVTTTNDMSGAAGSQSLDGTLGSAGNLVVKVGGTFPLASTAATGNYTGSFTVSANYN